MPDRTGEVAGGVRGDCFTHTADPVAAKLFGVSGVGVVACPLRVGGVGAVVGGETFEQRRRGGVVGRDRSPDSRYRIGGDGTFEATATLRDEALSGYANVILVVKELAPVDSATNKCGKSDVLSAIDIER